MAVKKLSGRPVGVFPRRCKYLQWGCGVRVKEGAPTGVCARVCVCVFWDKSSYDTTGVYAREVVFASFLCTNTAIPSFCFVYCFETVCRVVFGG